MSETGLEQIPDRDCGQIVVFPSRFKAHKIRSLNLNLGGVFND